MLNLKELHEAVGGTMVVAARKSEELDDFVRTVVAEALFGTLDKNMLRATKTYKAITFQSFVNLYVTRSELEFNLKIELQPNMTIKGEKIKTLFVACTDGCSVQNDDDKGADYSKVVTMKSITTTKQFNDVVAKLLSMIVRDIKPAK